MTKEEAVIRDIIGPELVDVQSLACAIEKMERVLFTERIPMSKVQVTKRIYPQVAKRLGLGLKTAARQVERQSNRCWDAMDEERMLKYIGRVLRSPAPPSMMITYLAYYCYYGEAFYEVVFTEPTLSF